jgi:fatty acid synthase subunit beta
LKAPTGLDQSRVPFSQRKIKFSSRFLPITAPFHSIYLKPAVAIILNDVAKSACGFDAKDLKIPVYATDSGKIWGVGVRKIDWRLKNFFCVI